MWKVNIPVSEIEFLKNVLCLKDEQLLNEALPLCKILNIKKGQRLVIPGKQQVIYSSAGSGNIPGVLLGR